MYSIIPDSLKLKTTGILGRKTGNLLSSLVGRAVFTPQLPPNAQKTCNIPIIINIRDVISIKIFINLPPLLYIIVLRI